MEQSYKIQQRVRVLLVDHSDLVIQGLKTTLSQTCHIVVVGTATTQSTALALLERCRPDVVVLDIQVGQASGIDLCRDIQESYPQIAVLFFTAIDDKRFLKSAILAGARGYLLRMASGQALAKAIEIVSAGRSIVDQQLTQDIIQWIRHNERPAQGESSRSYSESDMRVLSLVAAGKSNKEIAHQLNVAPSVLSARLRKIYKRLNISRRSEAASCFARWEQGTS